MIKLWGLSVSTFRMEIGVLSLIQISPFRLPFTLKYCKRSRSNTKSRHFHVGNRRSRRNNRPILGKRTASVSMFSWGILCEFAMDGWSFVDFGGGVRTLSVVSWEDGGIRWEFSSPTTFFEEACMSLF